MNVGITGTRHGAVMAQRRTLHALLQVLPIQRFHHGDCIGVDETAAVFIEDSVWTVSHPPFDNKYRAYHSSDTIEEPKPYLERNHDIVHAVELLIVVPETQHEVNRSGTWATYRYAVLMKIPRVIIYPSGAMVYEGV